MRYLALEARLGAQRSGRAVSVVWRIERYRADREVQALAKQQFPGAASREAKQILDDAKRAHPRFEKMVRSLCK